MTEQKSVSCTIHQPHFFPWLGYFNKLANTDVFIILDDVQYRDRYFQNRTVFSNINGPYWFTVPVHHNRRSLINEVRIVDDSQWSTKLLTHLQHNYGKCNFFKETQSFLRKTFSACSTNNLTEQNTFSLLAICEHLDIKFDIFNSNSFNIKGSPHEKLARLCSKVQADEIIFGEGNGLQYHGEAVFRQSSIKVVSQDFLGKLNAFNKVKGIDNSNYSILHYLCHMGAEETSELVKSLWQRGSDEQ